MRSPKGTVYKQAVKGVNDLATLRPDVAKSWHPTKNLPLTPEDLSPGSGFKVWWSGTDCGHAFLASPGVMTGKAKLGSKNICAVCSGHQILIGFNDLASLFPEIAAELHSTKNGDISPYAITHSSSKTLWWQCKEGHEWEMRVTSRTGQGRGCRYCNGRSILVGFNDLATTHPEMASEWHPTKNGELKPTEVRSGFNITVWWEGKCGHEWSNFLGTRVADNSGCPYCNGKVLSGYNDLLTIYPDLAKEWHPTKNGDLTPQNVHFGSRKKVWWICDKGHSFHLAPAKRIIPVPNASNRKYSICSTCCNRTVLAGFNDLATLRPDLALEWHPVKNGGVTPQMVSKATGKRFWWKCKVGHEWESSVANRNSYGCPQCTLRNSSKIEQALYEAMKKIHPDALNGSYLPVKWGRAKHSSVDIFLPSLQTIVEYDGAYWHRNKHSIDTKKTMALITAGYKVIRVRAKPLEFLDMKDANLIQIVHDKETAGELADMVRDAL